MRQAGRLRSCKAAVCLYDCRQPYQGCRSNDESRAPKAQCTLIASDRAAREDSEAMLRIGREVCAEVRSRWCCPGGGGGELGYRGKAGE